MKKYGVILADPPWQYRNTGTEGAAAREYVTMSDADIMALPVGSMASDDCVLLMWATWPKLAEACIPAVSAWGFDYVTAFPWIKITSVSPTLFGELEISVPFGVGFWARGCSELLIIARKGNPRRPRFDFTGLLSPNLQHSKKPASVHAYAESMQGPYLELFARRPVDGWDVWGNQVESTVTL